MTYDEALIKFNQMTLNEVSTLIHPYIERNSSDSDAEYVRRMVKFVMVM